MLNRLSLPIVVAFLFLSSVYAQPELDISFNGTGRVTTDLSTGYDIVSGVLIQPDKKIVAVGTYSSNINRGYFALTRYLPGGALDTSFGTDGVVITDFDASHVDQGVFAAALQPDGKILATGFSNVFQPGTGFIATIRYNSDGSLDTTFGTGGKVRTAVVSHINEGRAIAVGPDGNIAIAGHYFSANQNFQTVVARFDTAGGLFWTKTDFRGFNLGDSNIPGAVTIQPDGKILVVGGFAPQPSGMSGADITMMRFLPSGDYDSTFIGGGRTLISSPNVGEALWAVAVQTDGRIVAAGGSGGNFLVMRFDSNGGPDFTFNASGRVTTAFGNGGANATALAVRADGKIVVSGVSGNDFAVAVYNPDGSLDNSFSGDGKLTFNFGGDFVTATSMALDNLGRPLIGGTSGPFAGNNSSFAIARLYTLDPALATISGQAKTSHGTPIRGVRVGLSDPSGTTYWAVSSAFGFYRFDNVPTGMTYNLFVRGSKQYIFESRDIGVNEALEGADVIGTARSEAAAETGWKIKTAPVRKRL